MTYSLWWLSDRGVVASYNTYRGRSVPLGAAYANFTGTVLVFSWPSAGGYDRDRESANFSTEDLLTLFKMLTDQIGEKRVFILAHRLGNDILVNALHQAALTKANLRISELIFAAPDVDKDVFMKKAADIKLVAKNMILYASSADKALLASKGKAWETRMGYVGADGPIWWRA